jgi:hypothetical protein
MKQTAVEWLEEQLTEVDYNCINKTFLQNDKSLAGYKMRELFNKSKEMEKQQIIEAIVSANKSNNRNVSLNPEQYYKETYENK